MNTSDCMRTVRFSPYRKGYGPTFTLKLFYLGLDRIGYQLWMHAHYSKDTDQFTAKARVKTSLLFDGEDFRPSPIHSVDGDAAVKSLMTFLTLRPGGTDPDYFAEYTEAQKDYCSAHAETLSYEVMNRFGE